MRAATGSNSRPLTPRVSSQFAATYSNWNEDWALELCLPSETHLYESQLCCSLASSLASDRLPETPFRVFGTPLPITGLCTAERLCFFRPAMALCGLSHNIRRRHGSHLVWASVKMPGGNSAGHCWLAFVERTTFPRSLL